MIQIRRLLEHPLGENADETMIGDRLKWYQEVNEVQ